MFRDSGLEIRTLGYIGFKDLGIIVEGVGISI